MFVRIIPHPDQRCGTPKNSSICISRGVDVHGFFQAIGDYAAHTLNGTSLRLVVYIWRVDRSLVVAEPRLNTIPAKAPRIDPELVHQQIQALYRDPFRAVLAYFLEAVPGVEDIHAFVRKHPDWWAQAVCIFSQATGYSEKTVHEHNLLVRIDQMSDAEIEMRLEKLRREVLQKEAVDAEPALLPDQVEVWAVKVLWQGHRLLLTRW